MSETIITFDPAMTITSGLTKRGDFPADAMESGDPSQWGHLYVERRDVGMVAGIWQNAVFASKWTRFVGNEFFIVVEGSVIIEDRKLGRVTIPRGGAAVVPHGLEHRWIQEEPARLFFAKYTAQTAPASAVEPQLVVIDPTLNMAPSNPPAAHMLLSEGTPSTHEHTFFATEDGLMTVGMWSATPYRRKTIPYPKYEMMHILSGSTTFPLASGGLVTAKAGETIMMPKGVEAEWSNPEPIRKLAFNFMGA